jgi:hypothetical protein
LSFESFFVQNRATLNLAVQRINILECLSGAPDISKDAPLVNRLLASPYPYYVDEIFERDDDGKYVGVQPDSKTRPFLECVHRSPNSYGDVLQRRSQVLQNRQRLRESVPDDWKSAFDKEAATVEGQASLFLLSETISEIIEPYLAFLGYLAVLWLVLALLTTWTNELDKRFTYYFRLHRYASMVFFAITAVALWFGPLIIIAAIGSELFRGFNFVARDARAVQAVVLISLGASVFAVIWLFQTYRVYRDARYERHYLEDAFRLAFLIYLLAGPWAIYRAFMR